MRIALVLAALAAVVVLVVGWLAVVGVGERSLAAPYPPPAARDPGQDGARLQRTMRRLAGSTPEAPHEVRVLFYGQSITRSAWTRDVADRLRARFPHARLVVANRAVGGFTADRLVRTAELDVYTFWPDLILMHDLYQRPEDFDALIEALTSRTTAEIGIQTTHRRGEGLRGDRWDDKMAERFKEVAARHELELIDVRSAWKAYLDEHGLHPMALLLDEAGHLNGAGDALMSALVERPLRVIEGAPAEDKGVHDEPLALDADGRVTLAFTGTRVEAVFGSGAVGDGRWRVLVDGKPPSGHLGAWGFSRPNGDDGADWPWEVATPIMVKARATPVAETWTLTLRDFSPDYAKFRFSLHGSVTGADGEGSADADFVSTSGRVAIAAADWWLAEAHVVKGRRFVDGATIVFRALPLHTDVLDAGVARAPGERVVLVTGLEAGAHTLTLEPLSDGRALGGLRALRVHRPRPVQ